MSTVAKKALPGQLKQNDESGALSDLVSVLVSSGDLFYEWDLIADGLSWVGQITDVIGVSDDQSIVTGSAFLHRIHPEDLPRRMVALSQHFENAQPFNIEYRLRGDDGKFVWIQERAVAATNPDGTPRRLTGIVRDISQQKSSAEEVDFLTNHDALTGQYNRLRLREALSQAVDTTIHHNGQGGFLLVGLDKLNIVADVYGDDTADAIVLAVAQRIEQCLRAGDIIGRVGFDRFAVILADCTETQVTLVADRFLATIRDTAVTTSNGPMYVTASIGATMFPSSAKNVREVVGQADNALNSARRLGCDCFLEFRDVPNQHIPERPDLIIADQVKQAVREDRIVLAYQPIVSASDGTPAFYEGLVRMLDEEDKPVPAGVFVPIVEQMGLMRQVDRRVLDLGIAALMDNPEISLSINVSGMTAVDPVWLRQLREHLEARPDVASRLILEITETVAIEDIADSSRFVRSVNEFGCRVALDDFGAGYTSFRHLRALNVDLVKIDGSFVRDLPTNPDNQLFVRTLINLAKGIGLKTVAEWVENEEEADLLRREGIDYLQGWHYGKPEIEPPWLLKPELESAG
ncbi:MAG: EAL domain-containing protein [Alphaproteobacteria bacterium]|nr:EAL domain-containing protein [Alphaproteobacteria bacterium]